MLGAVTEQLLALAGLTGQLPAPDWSALDSQSVVGVVRQWMAQVAGSPGDLQQFLFELYYLFQGTLPNGSTTPAQVVVGSGTSADPWQVPIFSIANVGTVSVTAAVAKTTDGATPTLVVSPGLSVATMVVAPLAALPAAGFSFRADLTFAAIALPAGSTDWFPTFRIAAVAANTTAGQPLIAVPDPTAAGALFQVGAMALGMEYDAANQRVAPVFELTSVVTESASWDVIDLLNATTTIAVGTELLSEALSKAIQGFLQVVPSTTGDPAGAVAACLGVVPPSAYATTWPIASQDLLLGANQLPTLVASPLQAVAAYQSRCLTTPFATLSDVAWKALLPELAAMLTGGLPDVSTVTGSGTQTDPWAVPLVTLAGGSAQTSLCGWYIAGTAQLELHLSVNTTLTLPLTIAGCGVSCAFDVDVLQLTLPASDGTGEATATALMGTAFVLSIVPPQTATTFGGIGVTAGAAQVDFGWSRAQGCYASAAIDDLAIVTEAAGSAPVTTPIGTLQLGSGPSGSSVDWSGVAASLVSLGGAELFQYGGRPGVVLSTALGLLPNAPALFTGTADANVSYPSALALPATWPRLTMTPATFLTDPWPDVETQLGALFGSADVVAPLIRLISWGFSGTLPAADSPLPAGTIDDPWLVAIPGLGGVQPLVWTESAGTSSRIGFGVERMMSAAGAGGVQMMAGLRADLGYLTLASGTPPLAALPRLSGLATFSNGQTGYLVNDATTGVQIVSATLGAQFSLVNGVLSVSPVLTLTGATLDRATPLGSVTFAPGPGTTLQISVAEQTWTPAQTLQAAQTLLSAAITAISAGAVASSAAMTAALDFGAALSIFQQIAAAATPDGAVGTGQSPVYGVNPLAWQSLLANPDAFLKQQFDEALAGATSAASLRGSLGVLLGLDGLTIPLFADNANLTQAVLTVLDGLGLVAGAGGTAAAALPDLGNVLALLTDSAGYLKTQGAALLTDPTLQQWLVTQLQAMPPQTGESLPLICSLTPGGTVRLATSSDPQYPVLLGGALQLVASIDLDLRGGQLAFAVGLGAPALGAAVVVRDVISATPTAVTGTVQIAIEALPAAVPTAFAEPLVFYPASSIDVASLESRVWDYVLSTAVTQLVDAYVLSTYPVAQRLLGGLQLAVAVGSELEARNLLPALLDPVDWLASTDVLGLAGGGIDFDRLGALLADAIGTTPLTGPGGVTVTAIAPVAGIAGGLAIAALPYGLTFQLTAQSSSGVALAIAASPAIGPVQVKTARAGIAMSPATGVHADASLDVEVTLDSGNSFGVTAALQTNSMMLSVTAQPQGGTPLSIALVPFAGFAQLVAGGSTVLLEYVAAKLQALYSTYDPPTSGMSLVTIVGDLLTLAKDVGITDLTSLTGAVTAMAKAPIPWLSSQFGSAAATDLAKLLTDVNLPNLTAADRTLVFAPNSDVSVSFGVATVNGAPVVGVWVAPAVTVGFVRVSGSAGAAATVDTSAITLALEGALTLLPSPSGPFIAGPELQVSVDVGGTTPVALTFYPVGETAPLNADLFVLELVPSLSFEIAGTAVATATWIEKLVAQVLAPLAVDTLLSLQAVQSILNSPLLAGESVTTGSLLTGAQLLTMTGSGATATYGIANVYSSYGTLVTNPRSFCSTLGLGLLQGFVGVVGDTAGSFGIPFTAGQASGTLAIVGELDPDGASVDYGLRLQLQDLAIVSGDTREATPATTDIVLQIGKPTTADVANKTSWLTSADSTLPPLDDGLTVYFVKAPKGSRVPSFFLQAQLVNFGFDILGEAAKPLVSLGGVTLQEIELRTYLALTLTPEAESLVLSGVAFGAGAELRNLGIPLGPGFQTPLTGQNPVAASVLGAASAGQGSDSTTAVNPTFSAGFGWVNSAGQNYFAAQLYDATEASSDQIVLPIERAFGPIQCRQLGVGWEAASADLSFLFDGSVSLFGLTVDLDQFQLGIALTAKAPQFFDKFQFSLAGFSVLFEGGPVTIEGGLLETTLSDGTTEYDGDILVRAGDYGFAALGSFASITAGGANHPSFMVFLALDLPIGGPPYFFVTGLAGGFGYNRGFNAPPQDQVATFPFVAGVTNPALFGGTDAEGNYSIANVLATLNPPNGLAAAPPELGSYFLAAGIQFTSFEVIQAYALLVVAFGHQFEVALLGLATIQLPNAESIAEAADAFAYAELQIVIVVEPSKGLFQASAGLSPNSFVIDRACQLTGGFAFYLWFEGSDHPGEFVVTLGGYHPSFQPPDYYPLEPRLGFNWPISSQLHLSGDAYFALTPTAVMAGGALDATFHTGHLSAWFTANADMLICWKPFTYDIHVGVDIGASYKTFMGTYSVALGADVHIWGPTFKLLATVHWYVISFTISIGDTSKPPVEPQVTFEHFAQDFLPQAPTDTAPATGEVTNAPTVTPLIAAGLVRTVTIGTARTASVSPTTIAFSVQTLIPVTTLTVAGGAVALPAGVNLDVGVAPMSSGQMTSTLDVTIHPPAGGQAPNVNAAAIEAQLSSAAASLWNPTNDVSIDATPIGQAMMGIRNVTLDLAAPIVATPPIDIVQYLEFEPLDPPLDLPLSGASLVASVSVPTTPTPLQTIMATVMAPPISTLRQSVIDELNATTFVVRQPSELHPGPPLTATFALDPDARQDSLAAYAEATFRAQPMLGAANGTPAPPTARPPREGIRSRKSRPTVSKLPAAPEGRVTQIVRLYQNAFGQTAGRSWSGDGTSAERAVVAEHTRRVDDGMALSLSPGTTGVVDLGTWRELRRVGTLPLRIVAFDKHDSLLFDRVIGERDSRVSLPTRAHHLCVTVLDRRAWPSAVVAGWLGEELFMELNGGSLIGDSVVIRPAHHRNGPGSARIRKVTDVLGSSSGWVTTTMRQTGARLMIRVQSDVPPLDPGLEIQSAWLADGRTSDFAPIAVERTVRGAEGTDVVVATPAPRADAALLLAVRPAPGVRLRAVLALAGREVPDERTIHAWRIAHCGSARRDNQHDSVDVVMTRGAVA
jgi:hypothetical protein